MLEDFAAAYVQAQEKHDKNIAKRIDCVDPHKKGFVEALGCDLEIIAGGENALPADGGLADIAGDFFEPLAESRAGARAAANKPILLK